MSIVKKSIFINAPYEKVNAYGRDPKNWAQWYVHFSGPDKMTGEGEVGTIVEGKYSLLGIHFPVTIEVTEDTPTSWKGKISRSMEGEQVVTLVPKDSGTETTIEWQYTLPAGVLGDIADKLVVEKMIENATVHSLENWKAICEAMK